MIVYRHLKSEIDKHNFLWVYLRKKKQKNPNINVTSFQENYLTGRWPDPCQAEGAPREVPIGEDVSQTELVVIFKRVQVQEVADVDVGVTEAKLGTEVLGTLQWFIRHYLPK